MIALKDICTSFQGSCPVEQYIKTPNCLQHTFLQRTERKTTRNKTVDHLLNKDGA